jgi:hypothetical protein
LGQACDLAILKSLLVGKRPALDLSSPVMSFEAREIASLIPVTVYGTTENRTSRGPDTSFLFLEAEVSTGRDRDRVS